MLDPFAGYVPPQPAFRRCTCGALVLRQPRDEPTRGLKRGDVVTPLLGLAHGCAFVKTKAA